MALLTLQSVQTNLVPPIHPNHMFFAQLFLLVFFLRKINDTNEHWRLLLLLKKSEKEISLHHEKKYFEKILTCYVCTNKWEFFPVVSCLLQKVVIFCINFSQMVELEVPENYQRKVLMLIKRILLPNGSFAE